MTNVRFIKMISLSLGLAMATACATDGVDSLADENVETQPATVAEGVSADAVAAGEEEEDDKALREKRCCVLKNGFEEIMRCDVHTATKVGSQIYCAAQVVAFGAGSYALRSGSCSRYSDCNNL
jgi:hypothetical protein